MTDAYPSGYHVELAYIDWDPKEKKKKLGPVEIVASLGWGSGLCDFIGAARLGPMATTGCCFSNVVNGAAAARYNSPTLCSHVNRCCDEKSLANLGLIDGILSYKSCELVPCFWHTKTVGSPSIWQDSIRMEANFNQHRTTRALIWICPWIAVHRCRASLLSKCQLPQGVNRRRSDRLASDESDSPSLTKVSAARSTAKRCILCFTFCKSCQSQAKAGCNNYHLVAWYKHFSIAYMLIIGHKGEPTDSVLSLLVRKEYAVLAIDFTSSVLYPSPSTSEWFCFTL